MMRINLLPPEILERRKAERRFGMVILAALLIALVVAGVWVFAFLRLQAKEDELASVQQEVQSTNAEAAQLAIFEERAAELEARRSIAILALSSRRDWAKLMSEISLVLPSDVWVETLLANEDAGLEIYGWAIDSPDDAPDVGHKTMAKALVRLADLEQLTDVWLTSSAKSQYLEQPALEYTVTAKVSVPTTGSDTP